MNDNDFDEVALADPIVKEKPCKLTPNTYANSLNVFVGRQRSGKTY